MGAQIPTTEPTVFTAETTWEWDKSFTDFPASDGWQLTYYFRNLEAAASDLVAAWATEVTANGDGFEIRILFGSTGLPPGAYDLVGQITDGTKQHTPVNKRIRVLASADTLGAKSHARIMLDAIETRQQSRVLTSEQRKVQVNGRLIEYATDVELETARAHWAYLVQLERNPNARLEHAARFVG